MNYSSIHEQISVFLICAVFFSSINLPSSLADVRLPMIPHGPICYFNCCVCLNFGICISAGLQRGIKSQDKNAGTENAGKKMLISFAPLGSYSSCSFVFPLPTIAESDDVAAFYISFVCSSVLENLLYFFLTYWGTYACVPITVACWPAFLLAPVICPEFKEFVLSMYSTYFLGLSAGSFLGCGL